MIHWNNLSFQERIYEWRQHRSDVSTLDLDNQLNEIALFFSSIPIGTRCIDYYNPESWPTPWEIFSNSLFCENSVSVLIYHTLTIVNEDINIELILVDDGDDRMLLPLIENKNLLNYYHGAVVSIDDIEDIKIIERFQKNQIKSY